MVELDASQLSLRELNTALKKAAEEATPAQIINPGARHNLAVCVLKPLTLTVLGSVGYYCASMLRDANITVRGNAGWAFAEHLNSGTVRLTKNASLGAAASMKGGEVIIEGDAGSRAGISMKGGRLVIGGNAGFLTGFVMQKGEIIICGDAGDALGDSMYEGEIFVAGKIASLGTDAQSAEATPAQIQAVTDTLKRLKIKPPKNAAWKVVTSKKTLYHFDKLKLKDRRVI